MGLTARPMASLPLRLVGAVATATRPRLNPVPARCLTTRTELVQLSRLWLRYTAVSLVAVTSVVVAIYGGSHLYVQHKLLSDKPGPSSLEAQWSDPWLVAANVPELDAHTKRSIRAAWMTIHWSSLHSYSPDRLRTAAAYIEHALQRSSSLPAPARAPLIALYASILQDMHLPEALLQARDNYILLISLLPPASLDAAQALHALGRIHLRIGDPDQGLDAINQALRTVAKFESPANVPSLARRIQAQSYLDLSTHYMNARDFPKALSVQASAFQALTTNRPIDPATLESPSLLLHHLFIQQRIAALQIQHAEVQYALTAKPSGPTQELAAVVSSSESLAKQLFVPNTVYYSPSEHTLILDKRFTHSASLSTASRALARDIARTVATAYNLSALLLESPKTQAVALDYSEKALWWCGGAEGPSQHFSQAEWEKIWANYTRLRSNVQ